MAADELGPLARLTRLRAEVIEPKIVQFHGRIVGSAGDSLLVEFTSAINAVQCAIEAQEGLADQNANLPGDRRMAFRMGVNLGDVIAEGNTIHGDGVNVASRLEKLAEPGSICIGRNVYDQVKGKLAYAYADLGEQRLHNIPEPVHAYRVTLSKPERNVASVARPSDTLPLPDKPSIAVYTDDLKISIRFPCLLQPMNGSGEHIALSRGTSALSPGATGSPCNKRQRYARSLASARRQADDREVHGYGSSLG
jgi:adenylate cyclase